MARLISVLTIIAIALCIAKIESQDTETENIDIASIVQNDQLRDGYYNCFMETGPCTTDLAIKLKGQFYRLYGTDCAQCSKKQKENLQQIIKWYTTNKPDQLQVLAAKVLEKRKQTQH